MCYSYYSGDRHHDHRLALEITWLPSPHIPHSPKLRAEQVESWAFQAGHWSASNKNSEISGHYSAQAILDAVEDDEKPAILEAWKNGYKDGRDR